jgi:hypothetical protein
MSLIFGASVVAGAQTPPTKRASFHHGGSDEYWLVVDHFANRAVQLRNASPNPTHGTDSVSGTRKSLLIMKTNWQQSNEPAFLPKVGSGTMCARGRSA